MLGPWWTIWKRQEADGWLLKIGPFAIARYGWFESDSWFFYGFGRVIVRRAHARKVTGTTEAHAGRGARRFVSRRAKDSRFDDPLANA